MPNASFITSISRLSKRAAVLMLMLMLGGSAPIISSQMVHMKTIQRCRLARQEEPEVGVLQC